MGATKRKLRIYLEKEEKITNRMIKLVEDICSKYVIRIRQLFNSISREVVNRWYRDYHPEYYIKRKYSLHQIPHIEVDKQKGWFEFSFSPDRIKSFHRVTRKNPEGGREYMYQMFFLRGWHGGAYSGPPDKSGRPFPGTPGETPYWRKPYPTYEYWGYRATRYKGNNNELITDDSMNIIDTDNLNDISKSLAHEIMDEFNKKKIIIDENIAEYFRREYKKLQNELDKAWEEYIK